MGIIAFDVHGVLDTYPAIREIASSMYKTPGTEIYLISGSLFDKKMQEVLSAYSIQFDKYFSITQELITQNPKLITWVEGKPYADDVTWDAMKAVICKREQIDMLFDDSPAYGKYFVDIPTTYVEIHNGKWYESGRCKK